MKNKQNPDDQSMPRVLGVIPARGDSKRLPRKNVRKLHGHPLIAYTIRAAQRSTLLTDYVVSSEDDEILKVARDYGAPAPFVRPSELSDDEVRNIDVVGHAMAFMESTKGISYDILVLLQPTCPIRDPSHIDEAIFRLWSADIDTAVSVKGPFKKRDPILKRIKNEVLEPLYMKNSVEPNEAFYLYNASIYAVKRDFFVKNHKLISQKQIPVVMDEFHSLDIDTQADFLVAEAYLNHLLESGIRKEVI